MVYSVRHNVYCEILTTVSLLSALCVFGNGRLPIYHKFYASPCNVKTLDEVKNVNFVLWQIYWHHRQILSESAKFYRRYDETILAYILRWYGIWIFTKHNFQDLQGSVETLFRWGGKHKCLTLWHIYLGHWVANFIRISRVLQKIWHTFWLTLLLGHSICSVSRICLATVWSHCRSPSVISQGWPNWLCRTTVCRHCRMRLACCAVSEHVSSFFILYTATVYCVITV